MYWKMGGNLLVQHLKFSYMCINIEYTAGKGVNSLEEPYNYKVNVKMKFTMFQAF